MFRLDGRGRFSMERRMGRTYEALSQTRIKRERDLADEEVMPPTVFVAVEAPSSVVELENKQVENELVIEHPTADTALSFDLSRDNPSVPFIEVGSPRGSKPIYGPLVAEASAPLLNALNVPPPKAEAAAHTANGAQKAAGISFFPLSDQADGPLPVAAQLVSFHQPDHPLAAQFRAVTAGLAAQHPGVGCPLMIFMPVERTMDAASVVLNLAITRAREEKKRLLVLEADHENPVIATRVGTSATPGLRELLNRLVPMNVALHTTAQAGLFALPFGDADLPVPQQAEARLPELIEQLRHRFDWLLVNGPLWGNGGCEEWATLGDACYLVVRHEQWDAQASDEAFHGIRKCGGKLRGYLALRD